MAESSQSSSPHPERRSPGGTTSLVEKVYAYAEVTGPPLPADYLRSFEDIIPSFLFPPEIAAVLDYSDNLEEQAANLHRALNLFPTDYPKFIEMIRASRGGESKELDDQTIVRMYGVENSRAFLLALRLAYISRGKAFEWEKAGNKPKGNFKEALRYALKAEQSYTGRNTNLAFAAGLVFDILCAIAQRELETPAPVLEFAKKVFARGLETATVGLAISRRTKDLKFATHVYAACVLLEIGKVVAVLLKPDLIKFYDALAKDDLPNSAQFFCERRFAGISSDFCGSLILKYFPLFQPIADAILYQHQPYLLKHRGEADLGNLASVACLAANVVAHPFKPANSEDPAISAKWLRPEVRDLAFTAKEMFTVAKGLV